MTLQTDLQDAITRIQNDSDILHNIVHGDDATVITTENGSVQSVAKVIKDITDNIASAGIDLLNAVSDAENAKTAAEDARDIAVSVSGKVRVSADDTNAGELESKIIAGSNIVLSTQNSGGDEALVINASVPVIPNASTTTKGIVEKATSTEMNNGTADKFPDAATIKAHFSDVGGKSLGTQIFTSSGTWSRPAGYTYVRVYVFGGGGAAYDSQGQNGGTSSFGSYLSATGGTKGTGNDIADSGTDGQGAGGTINLMKGNPFITVEEYGKGGRYADETWSHGGDGGLAIEVINNPSSSVSVTVGAGGNAWYAERRGNAGVVIVESYG